MNTPHIEIKDGWIILNVWGVHCKWEIDANNHQIAAALERLAKYLRSL